MSLSLNVQFSKSLLALAGSNEKAGTVNHAMFYVSQSNRNGSDQEIYRVHSTNDLNNQYNIKSKRQKYNSPRSPVGEPFEILLTKRAQEFSAEEFANVLAQLPAPELNKGACQWWVLSNLNKMEAFGYVYPDHLMALLADPRMDSSRLMEFQPMRDALKATLSLSQIPEGLNASDLGVLEGLQHAVLVSGTEEPSDSIHFIPEVSQGTWNEIDNNIL